MRRQEGPGGPGVMGIEAQQNRGERKTHGNPLSSQKKTSSVPAYGQPIIL
jgi:hypothetical protein